MRALIIDDSKTMRSIIGRTIRELGFEILEAGDGRAALAELQKSGAVDLSLVDWNMPEMNGIEFVEAMRREPAWNSIKVIMITTASDAAHVERALAAGANEYLMKPFTKDMIVSKLEMLGLAGGHP